VSVRNTDTGKQSDIPINVTLVANSVATSCTFTVKDQNGNTVADGASVAAGTKLIYTATSVDPQNDVLVYKWTITQPGGTPSTLRLWGREIMVDTTGFTSGGSILITLLTTDRMLGTATFEAPTIRIT
jgi:hypothetical protein